MKPMRFKYNRGEGIKNRILSLVLCLVMVSTCLFCDFEAFAKTKEELEADIEKYDQQIEAAEGKLDELKNKKSKQEEYLKELEKQIAVMKDRDTAIQTQSNAIDEKIADLTTKLKQRRTEIAIIEEDNE